MHPSPILLHNKAPSRAQLKSQYLASWATLERGNASLRASAIDLIRLGAKRSDLVRWAVIAGHDEKYVRSVLSKILCGLGQRERGPGAGRRTPQEALAILAFARAQFGEPGIKYCLAAYRAGKAQNAAPHTARDAA